jgi:HlyD family secretion protein
MPTAKLNPITERTKVIPLPAVAPPKPIKPKKSRSKWLIWIALFALVAAAGAIWWWRAQGAVSFETQNIERGAIEARITATGTLNPVVNVQVGSQVSGNIKALYADFNTKVKQGQLVALIDPQIFQAQVDQASSAAESAAQAAVTAYAQIKKSEADVAGATANRQNLEAVYAKDRASALNATIQWQRAQNLFKDGVVSQQDYDTARTNYDAAQAQLRADDSQLVFAEHNIEAAQAQVFAVTSQWKAAEAQRRQSEAALRQSKINLEHTRIVAPVSGTVIARHFDVGQTVAASFQAPDIFDIAQDLTQMQVDTNVDESDVGTIQMGQAASFTVDAYPGTVFRGKITDIRKAPIVSQNVVTYDVVVQVANPDLKLFPGMTANVSILTARVENVVKIPNAALRFHPTADLAKKYQLPPAKAGAAQMYVMAGKQMKAVPVKLGISDGKFTAMLSGELQPGDSVVVRTTGKGSAAPAPSSSSGSPRRLGM